MDREVDFRYAPDVIQTCIGFADDPHKTIVREDGSLNYDYRSRTLEFVEMDEIDEDRNRPDADRYHHPTQDNLSFRYRLKPTFTHRDECLERTQEYGDAEAAIVTTREQYTDTTFSWTAFAHREDGARVDVVRWTLEADEAFGRAPSRVELELDGPEDDGLPTIIESAGTTSYWQEDAGRSQAQQNYAFLRSGDVREGAFAIVREGDLDPETVTVEWADAALAQTRRYWHVLEPFQNRLEVPDDAVMDLLVSAGRNILQARELVDGVAEYQVGPTEYRGLWIVDGHFILEAAHLMGRGDDAFQQGILGLLRRVKPSGAIQILPGHIKETGIAMATVVRQCELADDDDRLAELWPTLHRGLAYLESQRDAARERGEDYPAREFFPPELIDGGILGPYPGYTAALWVLAGVRAAARAGERLDLDGYEAFWETYDELLAGLRTYADRDRRETGEGIPYVPMNMADREYDRPQSATWAFAHAIYPGEVFDPDDRLLTDLLDLLGSVDDHQGIPAETGWIHDQGLWTYSATFYAFCFLYAGRSEKAIDYLYAFANHAAPNGAWREEQAFTDTHSSEYLGDMPHNWASAEFVRHVRNLLVFEREEELELLPALPEVWLPDPGSPVVVESTPTRFGAVDLTLRAEGDAYRLSIEREDGNQIPERVTLHWDGEVREGGGALTEVSPGVYHLPPERREISLVVA